MTDAMSQERKSDLDAMLAEIAFEIGLAIRQGEIRAGADWTDARTIHENGVTIDIVVEAKVRPTPYYG
jgi:hypothetical protein